MPLLPPGCPNSILYLVQFSRVLLYTDCMLWLVLQSLWYLVFGCTHIIFISIYFIFWRRALMYLRLASELLYYQGGSWTSDLLILLPPPSMCWDYSHVPSQPVYAVLGSPGLCILICWASILQLIYIPTFQMPLFGLWWGLGVFSDVCIWICSCGLVGDCWLTLSALN